MGRYGTVCAIGDRELATLAEDFLLSASEHVEDSVTFPV